jgi:small subunit ribosomal protein S15Ae
MRAVHCVGTSVGTLARAPHRGTLQRLRAFNDSGYIGEFEIVDDHRSGKVVIELIGRINKCGVISPRFDLQLSQIEQWTNNLLPSRQFGYIVMTTSLGIMDHEEVTAPSRDHVGTSALAIAHWVTSHLSERLASALVLYGIMYRTLWGLRHVGSGNEPSSYLLVSSSALACLVCAASPTCTDAMHGCRRVRKRNEDAAQCIVSRAVHDRVLLFSSF